MQKNRNNPLAPKTANSMIWGAWGGIFAAAVALIAQMNGELAQGTVWGYGMAGFFWLMVVADIRNWLAKRPLK